MFQVVNLWFVIIKSWVEVFLSLVTPTNRFMSNNLHALPPSQTFAETIEAINGAEDAKRMTNGKINVL